MNRSLPATLHLSGKEGLCHLSFLVIFVVVLVMGMRSLELERKWGPTDHLVNATVYQFLTLHKVEIRVPPLQK